jgi:hypothetical protein
MEGNVSRLTLNIGDLGPILWQQPFGPILRNFFRRNLHQHWCNDCAFRRKIGSKKFCKSGPRRNETTSLKISGVQKNQNVYNFVKTQMSQINFAQ